MEIGPITLFVVLVVAAFLAWSVGFLMGVQFTKGKDEARLLDAIERGDPLDDPSEIFRSGFGRHDSG